jgi:hypothetical protein
MAASEDKAASSLGQLLRKAALLSLTASVLLFQVANTAMLPLIGSAMTMHSSQWATALVAAAIFALQLVVAAISPSVGQLARSWGRRPVLLIAHGGHLRHCGGLPRAGWNGRLRLCVRAGHDAGNETTNRVTLQGPALDWCAFTGP